ncbi:zinc-dependent alcohol dehydrogenase family protein [Lactobacillus sp. ESL0681]|uniref:zinc-dependent alcohol dehydrogenase family protein n=1 Tax=Lactobacillus sp. ESL0681 TaxID=2983211 RepID=UPI0023F62CDB|nr:zinc-dependent alcohol dehydrogenase family protein [Lactobacillus sp. ESL0681]WEV40507.1 zinc-dependent alcohol dehydrogenase family protein [Lactobacillus sp. ESL0681]
MRAAVFVEPGKIGLEEVPKPTIKKPTDAIIKIVQTCVCGSDLWWYRGLSSRKKNSLIGHEAIGVVTELGNEVKQVKVGDFVIVPFTHGCGYCANCLAGFDGNCLNQEAGPNGGYQGEYLRYYNANWGLVKIPGKPKDYSQEQLNSLLTLADVMATGYHATYSAQVQPGDTVAVVGDGAVGLCGVISAKLRGAKRIIAMSRHEDRQRLAKEFGATDIVCERGEAGVAEVMTLTNGAGVDAALECVGTDLAIETASQVCRAGAIVGRVGLPQVTNLDTAKLFNNNVGLRGGIAAVTTHDRKILLDAVLTGKINPGKVFTKVFTLDQIQAAYEAMDKRMAIKSLVKVADC